MLIYLGKNKIFESFYSEGIIIEDSKKLNEETKELNEKQQMKVSDSFKNAKYFTNNKINYDLLDNNIDELILQYKADLLVASDKWTGQLDHFKQYCDVKYFKKIPNVSKEKLIEKIKNI